MNCGLTTFMCCWFFVVLYCENIYQGGILGDHVAVVCGPRIARAVKTHI